MPLLYTVLNVLVKGLSLTGLGRKGSISRLRNQGPQSTAVHQEWESGLPWDSKGTGKGVPGHGVQLCTIDLLNGRCEVRDRHSLPFPQVPILSIILQRRMNNWLGCTLPTQAGIQNQARGVVARDASHRDSPLIQVQPVCPV